MVLTNPSVSGSVAHHILTAWWIGDDVKLIIILSVAGFLLVSGGIFLIVFCCCLGGDKYCPGSRAAVSPKPVEEASHVDKDGIVQPPSYDTVLKVSAPPAYEEAPTANEGTASPPAYEEGPPAVMVVRPNS